MQFSVGVNNTIDANEVAVPEAIFEDQTKYKVSAPGEFLLATLSRINK